jgi:hypothetical protein
VLQAVEFAIERALFVARQTAAVLRSHIAGFLPNHIQPMMECLTLRRRIKTLIHALIDVMPECIDPPVDLLHPMRRLDMRVRTRRRFVDDIGLSLWLDNARRQRSRERHANQHTRATCFERKNGSSPRLVFTIRRLKKNDPHADPADAGSACKCNAVCLKVLRGLFVALLLPVFYRSGVKSSLRPSALLRMARSMIVMTSTASCGVTGNGLPSSTDAASAR